MNDGESVPYRRDGAANVSLGDVVEGALCTVLDVLDLRLSDRFHVQFCERYETEFLRRLGRGWTITARPPRGTGNVAGEP